MATAAEKPNLHELVDRLSPEQADAVRAVVVQFVKPVADAPVRLPRRMAFLGAGASEYGISQRVDELLDDGFGRD